MSPVALQLTLPASPESIPAARAAVGPLGACLTPSVFLDLRLLVSEVVTNAVRHARDSNEVQLVVRTGPGCVRVEVHQAGDGFKPTVPPAPAGDQSGGWGLFLVDKLTRAWGAERAPDAHVWFELEH